VCPESVVELVASLSESLKLGRSHDLLSRLRLRCRLGSRFWLRSRLWLKNRLWCRLGLGRRGWSRFLLRLCAQKLVQFQRLPVAVLKLDEASSTHVSELIGKLLHGGHRNGHTLTRT